MRLPAFRFTIRRMMIVVAITAIVLAGFVEYWRLKRLSADYQIMATRHERSARLLTIGYPGPEGHEPQIEHYQRLARKYSNAAKYPWLSVPVDPPEPPETQRTRWISQLQTGLVWGVHKNQLGVTFRRDKAVQVGTILLGLDRDDVTTRLLKVVSWDGSIYMAELIESGKIEDVVEVIVAPNPSTGPASAPPDAERR